MTGAELDRRLFNGEAVEVAMELFAENQRLLSSMPSEGERETRRRVASAAFDMGASIADKRDAEIARLKARAEKVEAERDAALAACAEMRAALECAAPHHQGGHSTVGRMIRDALAHSDLGAGKVLVERESIDEWRDLITDLVFDLDAHSRARKAVADLDALLRRAGG